MEQKEAAPGGFVRGLGFFDSTMIVAGSMIGSGVFIVSADIARQVGASGWLLATWLITGFLTVSAALVYGELAAMMPRAGGQYVYLGEAFSPLLGFLYGWALFLVIQTGTIAAVAVAFARFLGVLVPWVSPDRFFVAPINLSRDYALSFSSQQLVAVLLILLLTLLNARGLRYGKWIQNLFTSAKTLGLLFLIVLGLLAGAAWSGAAGNFANLWTPQGVAPIHPELPFVPELSASAGWVGLLVALCLAQVGSLFAANSWDCVTYTAGEVRDPQRNLPRALAAGTIGVIIIYCLVNVTYLRVLPMAAIQGAADDRVATAALQAILGSGGAAIMAAIIVISTFGCDNGLVLSGARVYYAMAKDGLFFRAAGRLNRQGVPAVGLFLQSIWAILLILPRTRLRDAAGIPLTNAAGLERYGNLYSNLLDYVIFSTLVFYALTIWAVVRLRRKQPQAERPYRAIGYPYTAAAYIALTAVIFVVLLLYRTKTTWPGLLLVLSGIPVYLLWRLKNRPAKRSDLTV